VPPVSRLHGKMASPPACRSVVRIPLQKLQRKSPVRQTRGHPCVPRAARRRGRRNAPRGSQCNRGRN
jgi:hypothetical protein